MMADQVIKADAGTGKAERRCAWCGSAFRPGSHNAKFCGLSCKERMRFRTHHKSRLEAAREYNRKNSTEILARRAERYRKFKEDRPCDWRKSVEKAKDRIVADRAANPEKHAAYSRSWTRRRAAERAVSLLLMPVHKLEAN